MTIDTANAISLLAIALIILQALVQRFVFDAKILERLKSVEIKSDLFWGLVEKELPKILHSPHTPVFDALLEKMESSNLTNDEKIELKQLLKDEVYHMNPDYGKRLVAVLLLARLEQQLVTGKRG